MADAPYINFDVDMYPSGLSLSGIGWTCQDQGYGFTANVRAVNNSTFNALNTIDDTKFWNLELSPTAFLPATVPIS